MSMLKLLLLPFAMLYDFIMDMRNRMYDMNWKPSVSFDLPVIGVGNLAVGGTGKTPMIEYLIRLITPYHPLATLSRGYKRKTRGLRIATDLDNATTIGDEPYQLYVKYGKQITVSVCEDRAFAIPHIIDQVPGTEVILMDDAFQHRRVRPGFSVLLTEYYRPFYNDHVLPYGRLREGPEGANRADAIIVTKCPKNLSDDEMMRITHEIHAYTVKPVFFSSIRYGAPQPLFNHDIPLVRNVILVSAIANHAPLEDYIIKNYNLVKHLIYRDHYYYTRNDLQYFKDQLQRYGNDPICIITTEKDCVKFYGKELKEDAFKLPIFYLPIEMEFVKNGKDFDALVLDFINRG